MSSKLSKKAVLKDPDQMVEAPRLYSMLKDEKSKTRRERSLDENLKIMHKKYLDIL